MTQHRSPCSPPPPSLIRGKFRSKPWAAVLDEAKRLVESGVVELNLIAGMCGGDMGGRRSREGKEEGFFHTVWMGVSSLSLAVGGASPSPHTV